MSELDPRTAELHALNNRLAVMARERERGRRALERAIAERDLAYEHLRRVQDCLPICMDCHAVRSAGSWQSLMDYFRANDIPLTHGLCDACAARRHEELDRAPQG